ncbi:MAG: hypothetical protein ACQKBY_01770 [Verrucomicrobiales bacterium]
MPGFSKSPQDDASGPELFLVDGIGPFFRAAKAERINWSKIPFHDLPEEAAFWEKLRGEFASLADQVRALGYNAVTLDDLAHLTPHPWHDEETNRRIGFFVEEFRLLFGILRERGLRIWLTSDVLTMSPAVEERVGPDGGARNAFFLDLVRRFFGEFPEVEGLILRIGEADGLDVRDPLRSYLHLKSPKEVNGFLRDLLPETEALGKKVVLRTWTVGAHRIGDLIWHRGRLGDTLRGIDSPNFILSMKPGESDFFRHLPLNRAFFGYEGPKILELQARREYEGAGEIPSYLGFSLEKTRDELAGVKNLVGVSVWAQTGGWHRFKRLTFLDENAFWAELNTRAAIDLFQKGLTPEQSLAAQVGAEKSAAAVEFLHHADHVMTQLYYIPEFARLKLFFRRVRIPPLLHLYWDSLFIHSPIRKLLRHFVTDHEAAIREGVGAMRRFPRMIELAEELAWPVEDVECMRDTCGLIALAREYYFSDFDEEIVERIEVAKKAYKKAWPREKRARYRIKTDFAPPKLKRRTVAWASRLLLRDKRAYRPVMDHFFTLNVLSFLYRLFRNRSQDALPKFVRKSAMGIDSLFR